VIPSVTASEQGKAQACNPGSTARPDQPTRNRRGGSKHGSSGVVAYGRARGPARSKMALTRLERRTKEGESPVKVDLRKGDGKCFFQGSTEGRCLRVGLLESAA